MKEIFQTRSEVYLIEKDWDWKFLWLKKKKKKVFSGYINHIEKDWNGVRLTMVDDSFRQYQMPQILRDENKDIPFLRPELHDLEVIDGTN